MAGGHHQRWSLPGSSRCETRSRDDRPQRRPGQKGGYRNDRADTARNKTCPDTPDGSHTSNRRCAQRDQGHAGQRRPDDQPHCFPRGQSRVGQRHQEHADQYTRKRLRTEPLIPSVLRLRGCHPATSPTYPTRRPAAATPSAAPEHLGVRREPSRHAITIRTPAEIPNITPDDGPEDAALTSVLPANVTKTRIARATETGVATVAACQNRESARSRELSIGRDTIAP